MPFPVRYQELVDAANAAVNRVPLTSNTPRIDDHSVGCAVLTKSGKTYGGVNIFHWSGGPCAENVALGNALQAGEVGEDFVAIVAVGNRQRGVISPCGRCRQQLLDYYPWIEVIVADKPNNDVTVVGVRDLLPYAYVWKRDRVFKPTEAATVTEEGKVDMPVQV